MNSFFGIPAAGCCPLEGDVTSEGNAEAESERRAPSAQPAGRRRPDPSRQAVAGGAGAGSEPVAEAQPGRFWFPMPRGALPWRGVQVGERVRPGWGPQRPPLAWMIRVSDWGVLPLDFATSLFRPFPNPFLVPQGTLDGVTVREGDALVPSLTFGGFSARALRTTDARSQARSAGMGTATAESWGGGLFLNLKILQKPSPEPYCYNFCVESP